MTQHWNQSVGGTWDTGDFNYDGSVNTADFTLMTRTYNTGLGSQAAPAVSGDTLASAPVVTPPAVNTGSPAVMVQTEPAASVAHHHAPAPKHPTKQRR
jgi:hypothetical protein